MPLDKLTAFTKKVQDLADKPNGTMSAAEVKAQFDAAPDEVRVYLNRLIDDLQAVVDGDSGADNIGATGIAGLTGGTVQALLEALKALVDTKSNSSDVYLKTALDNGQLDNRYYTETELGSATDSNSGADKIGATPISTSPATVQGILEWLKTQIDNAVLGQIPDGTVTVAKLSFDPATQVELDEHKSDYLKHTGYAVATGSANAYAATLNPALSAYAEGVSLRLKINVANTGASTVNVNGLGAKPIKKSNGNDVITGNLKLGSVYTLAYDGTSFILQGEGGEYGTALAPDVLAGKTIGTENGLVTGTIPIPADGVNSIAHVPGGAGELYAVPPNGYFDGGRSIKITDPDFINSNIKNGVNVFGVVGTMTGKKWAKGTGTPSAGTLTISGLDFTPSIVIVKDVNLESTSNGNGNYSGLFIKNATLGSVYDIVIRMEQTTFINTTCNVNSTGFSFYTNNNSSHYWIAIE